ncbi:hypothetical protein FQR65_LT09762 [Abscondita terminalis]|nr:hypothetical protein FQR65_LT09762 [Abscondita terminalis]
MKYEVGDDPRRQFTCNELPGRKHGLRVVRSDGFNAGCCCCCTEELFFITAVMLVVFRKRVLRFVGTGLGKTSMDRWQNVRDDFMRFGRKRMQSNQPKTYLCSSPRFLMRVQENTPTEVSSQAEEGNEKAVGEEPPARTNGILGPARFDHPQRKAASSKLPRKRHIGDVLIAFMEQCSSPMAVSKDDDNPAFFNSSLPMVREFTSD